MGQVSPNTFTTRLITSELDGLNLVYTRLFSYDDPVILYGMGCEGNIMKGIEMTNLVVID